VKLLVWLLCGGIGAFVIVAVARPGATLIAFEILVLYLGGLLVLALAARADAGLPRDRRSLIEQALAAPRPPERRVAELERIERVTALGVAHAGDLHVRLGPVLRAIAQQLLAARGVDPERVPEQARELLGDEAWELVRPGLARPADAFAPGVPAARLSAAVAALERMAR
jgi:hypothetical protein